MHKETKLYGTSDDLVEAEGGVNGEYGNYFQDESNPIYIEASDGTILKMWYGKKDLGIWSIKVITQGSLFAKWEECLDEDADPYSDIVYFNPGLHWIKCNGENLI